MNSLGEVSQEREMTAWFCILGDQQYGPMSGEQFRSLVAAGNIQPSTLVRQGENGRWIAAEQVQGLLLSGAPAATPPRPPLPAPPPAAPPSAAPLGSLPMARPLPITSPAAAAPLPVGTPVASAAQPAQSIDSTQDAAGHKPKARNTTTWIIVGAVGAGVLIIAAIVIALNPPSSRKRAAPSDVAEAPVIPDDAFADEDTRPPPVAPVAAAESGRDDLALATKPAVNGPAAGESDREQLTLKSVSSWRDAKGRTVGLGKLMSVKILAAWTGPLELSSTKPDPPSSGAEKGQPSQASAGGKSYVFVQLLVTNLKPEGALRYAGWNNAGTREAATAAVLSDDQGNILPLAPLERAGEGRLKGRDLKQKEAVTDLLVFEAPTDEFEHLRLALPYAAVGKAGKSIGLKISRDMLAAEPPPLAAAAPAASGVPASPTAVQVEIPNASSNPAPPPPAMTEVEKLREAREALRRGIDGEPDPPQGQPKPGPE